MGYGLGIDTGGTYTDGVIYDFENDSIIARTKALTTKDDLSIGINNVLNAFSSELLTKVTMVSLSTTLATNACVEGKGSRSGLFLLGFDEELLSRLGGEYGLNLDNNIFIIKGRHGQRGEVVEEPDWDRMKEIVFQWKDKVDAFGIVEYWGIRNPGYEMQAKEKVTKWSGLPTVCAHELSNEINSLRRAATTLLNAKLIPLIDKLIRAVKASLMMKGIQAPLMIVRGDGSLMTDKLAREKPVETLLSGPAASVVGGMKLSGEKDCIVVDIGGTTTDLAVVRGGVAVQVEDGVDVGEWRTGTKAIQIKTIGLGGDSLISFDRKAELVLGPRKATPLAWLADQYPNIKEVLREVLHRNHWHTLSLGEFFYRIGTEDKGVQLEDDEAAIMNALEKGPLSVEQLADTVGTRPYFLRLERLEYLGLIARSGLTPTDLMHVRGDFTAWDREAACIGAEILANRLELSVDQLVEKVFNIAGFRLYSLISAFLLERTGEKAFLRGAGYRNPLLPMGYRAQGDEISFNISVHLPLVGIGAPTHVFLPYVAQKLGVRCIVPQDALVANAVGAITGSILAEETVTIKPHYEPWGIDGYSCHSSRDYYKAPTYEEALEWSRREGERLVKEKAADMGAVEMEVVMECKEEVGKIAGEKAESILLETVIIARGMGKIALGAE